MDSSSIFNLFTHLCQAMCNDFNKERVFGAPLGNKAVKRFRKQAFEILLYKSHDECHQDVFGGRDPMREFQFHQFDMRQNAKTALDRDRCDQLETCIEKLLNENQFFRSDSGQAILMLLLLMKNSINYNVESGVTDIYPFGFFAPLRSCTETNPYMWLSPEIQCGIPKKLDVDIQNQYAQFNPYMPNPLIFVSHTDPEYEQIDYFFKLNFELSSPLRRHSRGKAIEHKSHSEKEEISVPEKTTHKGPLSLSWINLGRTVCEVTRERPFVSEIPSSIYYLKNLLKRQECGEGYTLKVVADSTFLMDLKYLCSGVESDSFQFDVENVEFRAREQGLSIKNIGAESLSAMSKKFMDFGTQFKRLEMATSVIPGTREMPVQGFVYKSLSKVVNQFLFSIRHFIFNGPKDETMLQFSLRMRKFTEIISFLGRLFKVQPDGENEEMAKGSRLLIYLYDILVDEMNKQEKLITLVTIMRDCCQAYYQLFQTWIFNGILTDPYNELFINYTNQYKIKTKYSFEKSFYLQRNEVPPFLKGYEHDLLLCGMYTMLLREYQPNHKIFSLTKPPTIQIRLTYEGIQQVKDICRAYLKDGYKVCGGRISVRKIFTDMREKEIKLKQTVSLRFKENLIKWQEQMGEEKKSIMAIKRKRIEEVQQQIQEKKLVELEQRRAEIQLEKECEEYDRKLELMDLQKLADERRQRIEYYEELNQIANEKRGAIDKTVASLEGQLKQLQSPNEDICNENYKRQLEENLDILNANSEQFAKNKTRVMGSQLANLLDEELVVKVPSTSSSATTLTEAQKNKLKILSEEFDLKSYENCDNKEKAIVEMGKKILTDAQKNKAKILAHEFNNNLDPVEEDDVVLIEKSTELTEMEKNRFTAMSHHLTDSYFKVPEQVASPRSPVPAEDLSEMERNRLKVMSHEFAIDVPIEQKLAMEINEETMTELQKNRRRVLYGNVTEEVLENSTKNNLQLDLNQLSDRDKNRRKFYESELGQQFLTTPSVVAIVPSPMSMTSDPEIGGDGKEEKESNQGTSGETDSKEESQDPIVPEICETSVNERPVKRISFMEFLKPLISSDCTNVFDEDGTMAEAEEEDIPCPSKNQFNKRELSKLSSLNFESLNQFLQQSLTIPLKTQLELMNNEILKMYLLDLDIYSHFKSLRNYFFLMDGEFGIHICTNLIGVLESGANPTTLYSYHMLNTVLEQAFGASVSGKDKNGARLSFALSKTVSSQDFDLLSPNVLGDLELVYDIEWPLNLILCQRTIQQYSSIFQYLLKVRRISWVLENSAYRSLKDSAKALGKDLLSSGQYRHVQLIRHKLAQFVNCLKNHITSSAIQGSWKRFNDELETVTSMMDLQSRHSAYIKQIRFLCMLNRQSAEFQNIITDIFKITLRFNHHLNASEQLWHTKEEDPGVKKKTSAAAKDNKKVNRPVYVHPNYEKMCRDELDFDRLCNYVIYLGEKIVRRGYQVELAEFLNLVNVNGFYKGVQPRGAGDTGATSSERKK